MQYRQFGNTGFRVSAVAYGGIVSATEYDGAVYETDGQPFSDRWVSWAVEQGVNYFDVAPTYGNAEKQLGASLAPYRKNVYLACKTEQRTRPEAQAAMENSMRLLKTDYFDVYQLHGLSTMEELETAFAPGGAMEVLRNMKEQGLARKLGITAHSEAVALKALELYDFDTVLFPFNWHMNLSVGMGSRLIQKAKEKGMGVVCMKSMIERAWNSKQEQLSSPFPKSWCRPFDPESESEMLLRAVKYVFSLGVDLIVPPGNFTHFSFGVEHIDEILSHPLTKEDLSKLKAHLELVKDRPFFAAGKTMLAEA